MNNSKILMVFLIALIPFTVLAQQKTKKKKHTAKKSTTVVQPLQGVSSNHASVSTEAEEIGGNKVVTVTSAFKPSLKNAAKINFTAATAYPDTAKIPLKYQIPSQSLFFSYNPVSIKPVELAIDTALHWENDQYIKVGYGNFATSFLETGLAFGDGKKAIINLRGNYTNSKGNLPDQEFTKAGIEGLGVFNSTNHEITSRLYYNNSLQYRYPAATLIPAISKEDLQQQFNLVGFELGLQNKLPTDFGTTYHPQIKLNSFFDSRNGSELNFIAKAPINEALGKIFAFDLKLTADITSLHTAAVNTINNNLFYIDPSVQFKTPNFSLNVGIQPSWDNDNFSMLPNITAESKITDEHFILQAGWIGYFQKNSYQSLAAYNPYIMQPTALLNSKIMEQYAGFKGSLGKHLTYNARLSFLKINDQPLFVSDTGKVVASTAKSFLVLYEPQLQALQIHGEIGYTVQEKLSFIAAMTFTQYTNQSEYAKPWGLLPLQLTGTVRYSLTKNIQLKSDIFFWDGTQTRNASLQTQKLDPALDLNAGLEFKVIKRLNFWIQFNNIINDKYQRWDQYQVLGFNVLGGVVYSFR